MKTSEMISLLTAANEGKQLQMLINGEWRNFDASDWVRSFTEFRVAPEPRKPREYWLEIAKDGSVDSACREHEVRSIRGGELVLVREVIE